MAYTESGKQASYKYRKQNIRRLSLDYRLPEFEAVKAAAAAAGMPAAAYVKAAVAAYGQQAVAAELGQQGSAPDAGQVERPDVTAADDAGRVRFSIAAAALEDLRGPDETPAAAAVRVFRLGVAAARAPQGERGAPEQGRLTPQSQKK